MNKIKVHPLRAWRASQGLTQEELAKMIGYQTPTVIQGIESGRIEPKIGEVLLLCHLSRDVLTPKDFTELQIK